MLHKDTPTSFQLDLVRLPSSKPASPGMESRSTGFTGESESLDQNATTFPSRPENAPVRKDYVRMALFVLVHLFVVLLVCSLAWVARGGDKWGDRLVFVSSSVAQALLRVTLAAWWLKAASPRLALVFAEIDAATLALVGGTCLVMPYIAGGALQFELGQATGFSQQVGKIFAVATLREACKLLSYLLPLWFGQVKCASHLLFTGAIAGSLSSLYADMFTAQPSTSTSVWHFVAIGFLYTMMYSLWTSMGAALICHIKQKRLGIRWIPTVLIVPVIFHAGYLMAVYGQTFGWQWALISTGYWLVSAVVLRAMLVQVLPFPNDADFVTDGDITV